MADKQLFPDTHKWRNSIALVESLEDSRFPLLLSRVLQKLHLKETAFNEKEEAHLQELLNLDEEKLRNVLDCCSYVFQQAAYHRASVSILSAQLSGSGLGETKCNSFGAVWRSDGETFIEHLRNRMLGGVPVVKAVNWKMDVVMSQDELSRVNKPRVVVQFTTVDPDADADTEAEGDRGGASVGSGAEEGRFEVELDHAGLQSLYLQLEKVQAQLDGLT